MSGLGNKPLPDLAQEVRAHMSGGMAALNEILARMDAVWAHRRDLLELCQKDIATLRAAGIKNPVLSDAIVELVKQRDDLLVLLYEVLVGMRNSPVRRAKELLAAHGKPVPENVETFESMREQRDNALAGKES